MSSSINDVKNRIKDFFNISDINKFENELTMSCYKDNKLLSEAVKIGKELIHDFPQLEFSWRFLGYAYALQGNIKESIACYQKLVSINPRDYTNWIALSFAYRGSGDILISNWINYNLEYFMRIYEKNGFPSPAKGRLNSIINELKERKGGFSEDA